MYTNNIISCEKLARNFGSFFVILKPKIKLHRQLFDFLDILRQSPNLLVILLSLESLGSNSVQISLSVLGDSSATLGALLNDTNLLQSLQNLSVDRAGSISVVRRSGSSVDGVAVSLVQSADTNILSKVNVSSDGGRSLVEPSLSILGREFVTRGGLDQLNVTRDLELTLSLQEGSVSVNELLSRNVSITQLVSLLHSIKPPSQIA